MVATRCDLSPTHGLSQPGGDGLTKCDNHCGGAVPALLLLELLETHKQRQDILRTENGIGNRIEAVYRRKTGMKAEERARFKKKASTGMGQEACDTLHSGAHPADDSEGGDQRGHDTRSTTAPALAQFLYNEAVAALQTTRLVAARDFLHGPGRYAIIDGKRRYIPPEPGSRADLEKRMERMAEQLPVWHWAEGVRGFGALGLAQIVAECGDLANYDDPAKVWKRMGLGLVDGERQGKRSNADEALRHGYNPQRRSIMHVIGDSLMKGNREGEYRTYYLSEKARQAEKHPADPPIAAHMRALRHMEKRLLRDLWRAWRATTVLSPKEPRPFHAPTALAAD